MAKKRKSAKKRTSKRRKSKGRSRNRNTNKVKRRTNSVAKKRSVKRSKRQLISGGIKNGLAGIAAGEIVEMGANAVIQDSRIGLAAGAAASYGVGKGAGIIGYAIKKVVTGGLNLGGLNLGGSGVGSL